MSPNKLANKNGIKMLWRTRIWIAARFIRIRSEEERQINIVFLLIIDKFICFSGQFECLHMVHMEKKVFRYFAWEQIIMTIVCPNFE